MANRWGNNRNSDKLFFLGGGSKITTDGDYSHKIKKTLVPWKKSYDKPRQHIKKQRHDFANIHLVKAMVFPVVMYGCESWTIKKAENRRTDAFELWCWRRVLRVPWTERRSNQSILEINQSRKSILNIQWKGWCWSWSSNTLATWWEEPTH